MHPGNWYVFVCDGVSVGEGARVGLEDEVRVKIYVRVSLLLPSSTGVSGVYRLTVRAIW